MIFIAQNSRAMTIYLGFEGQVSLAVALLLAAVAGMLLVAIPSTARIMQLRRALKGSIVRTLLGRHLRHTATTARLTGAPVVLAAGMRAARRDQRAFDDLVEIGLGRGLLTRRVLTGLVR